MDSEQIKSPPEQTIIECGACQVWWMKGERAHFKGVRNDLQEAITSRENHGFLLDAELAAAAAERKLINLYMVEVKPISGVVRRVLSRDELAEGLFVGSSWCQAVHVVANVAN